MKTTSSKVLFFLALATLLMAFAACSSESTIPTARHDQPIHNETHWN